ncbi:hypothetical protein [Actinoallomurus acaciae]|uniref:Uncharacterized protein n=1 Tax=Actinoallomurus acaciae TaxID=502577 RepID=A0ABV5Y8N2_9ACTN
MGTEAVNWPPLVWTAIGFQVAPSSYDAQSCGVPLVDVSSP